MLYYFYFLYLCFVNIAAEEVCDGNYCLVSKGEQQVYILEYANSKCDMNSWILEIYDESIITLLSKLNISSDQKNILLGMKINNEGWMWSDNRKLSEAEGDIEEQETPKYAVCISKNDKYIRYSAKDITQSYGFICSKNLSETQCHGWYNKGNCYFKSKSYGKRWYEAHNECIKNQSILAIFHDRVDSSFIGWQQYWISLSQNTWKWQHSDTIVTFNKWESDYRLPNSVQCAYSNYNNKWKSMNCSNKFFIVCMRADRIRPTSDLPSPINPPVIENINNNNGEISSNKSFTDNINTASLSTGAKAGIGVSLAIIIIVVLVIIVALKYPKQFRKSNDNKNEEQNVEDHYAVVQEVKKNHQPETILSYAKIDFPENKLFNNINDNNFYNNYNNNYNNENY